MQTLRLKVLLELHSITLYKPPPHRGTIVLLLYLSKYRTSFPYHAFVPIIYIFGIFVNITLFFLKEY